MPYPCLESTTSRKAQLPDDFEGGFSFCDPVPSTRPFAVDTVEYVDSAAFWFGHAGDAVTAELRMPSGEVYPVVRVEGYLFGWFPLPAPGERDAPTLTGFSADGTQVGKAQL